MRWVGCEDLPADHLIHTVSFRASGMIFSLLTGYTVDLTPSPTHSTFPRSATDRQMTPRQLEAGQKRARTSGIQNNRSVLEGNELEE